MDIPRKTFTLSRASKEGNLGREIYEKWKAYDKLGPAKTMPLIYFWIERNSFQCAYECMREVETREVKDPLAYWIELMKIHKTPLTDHDG